MKFTLKDYQRDAVIQVLDNLERSRKKYHDDNRETSFTLTATTGAGKTVMAAAAIEALFYGNDEFDFDPDPGAVVIWFSDDPNLNDQTRLRLMQASEKLTFDRLVTVEYPFSVPQLDAGKVYFLNTQKLTATSRLTMEAARRKATVETGQASLISADDMAWTIWETLAETIDDSGLTVYLVVDEAHRGFNTKSTRDKSTIVKRLVDGVATGYPMPVVWGISATISHFTEAMNAAQIDGRAREALPAVSVDPARVQASGLIKDKIVLDIPAEPGNLETALATHAAQKLQDSSRRWERYLADQARMPGEKAPGAVTPLLVVQIPNTEDQDAVGLWLDTVQGVLGDLTSNHVRHVLGDHSARTFGSWDVEWIEPQRIQETNEVRIVIAKEAISTGWDCPRAEVLLSFRPARDHDHITQLLGRMVRTPLARRVPGDERLNSVDCILPHFDRTTAGNVARFLTGLIDEMPGGGTIQVLLDGRELGVNPNVPAEVWDCFDKLPSLVVPQRGARPVKQLVSLAQALAADGLKGGALKSVEKQMHLALDGLAARYDGQLRSAEIEVRTVRGMSIAASFGGTKLSYADFALRADDRAIRVAFEDAKRAFGADIAQSYVNYLAGEDDPDADDDGLRGAYVQAAALATVGAVRDKLDDDAKGLVDELFADYRVAMRSLSDERRDAYEDIRAQAVQPQLRPLQRPRTRMADFKELDGEQERAADLVGKHLMSDVDGWYPTTGLNDWEKIVVHRETSRLDCVGWYRNPSVSSADSLGITFRDGVTANWRAMHPDFIVFNEVGGAVKPSIVDPHGTHLDDALVKLQGLARYAQAHGAVFHRIDAVAHSGELRVLDMKNEAIREEVLTSKKSAAELFAGELAVKFA
ncbi:DEAD/DEAH box helicase [Curtobacterium poinsettiae]|uniref:DEAD/DEAH box helicase n=1 Tax=Curtobacterium poinsettiae TaxID=159612 RepID=UPI00235EE252|nr:DEAD/DEAH box helicase family protein [Curtobacterium flaccumfaciens]MDD1386613.1 DEAD/DEAH box helicase family protein [Curtobacterium flaccumfaciens pv. poinsettiae]